MPQAERPLQNVTFFCQASPRLGEPTARREGKARIVTTESDG